jgi:hypothetical protein
MPASEVKTIPLAWPFAKLGLGQVVSLPKSSRGRHTYLLVAVDKFSKWIEESTGDKLGGNYSCQVLQVHHMQIWGAQ